MKIGYLHIGISQAQESGVTRYGRLIAAEARKRSELDVIEKSVVLGADPAVNRRLICEAAQFLAQADVVHLQYSKYIWGSGWRQLNYLKLFINHCSRPFVVTLHDIYPNLYPANGFLSALRQENLRQRQYSQFTSWALRSTLNSIWNNYLADNRTLRCIFQQAAVILVCTQVEKQRLNHFANSAKIAVIPHFVEQRVSAIDSSQSKANLGLEDSKVVTLQGFIHPRKGYQLVIEAMSELPQDVTVIFAGGASPGNESYLKKLAELSKHEGIGDRVHITGYLSTKNLEQYLMASDLAICPFETLSASGSLSTWISFARPILCSDLPQIAEYNQLEPSAIRTFRPYTASALAQAIRDYFQNRCEDDNTALIRLREKLLISNIFDQHLKFYRGAFSS